MKLRDVFEKVGDLLSMKKTEKVVKDFLKDELKLKLLETIATTIAYNLVVAAVPLPVVRKVLRKGDFIVFVYISNRNDPYVPDFGHVILKLFPTLRGRKLKCVIFLIHKDIEEKLHEYLPEGVMIL